MNDTTRRFLTAIVERIPAGSEIVELRLFPSIRQGGIESGVAVVAVEPPEPEVVAELGDAVESPVDGTTGEEVVADDQSDVASGDVVAADEATTEADVMVEGDAPGEIIEYAELPGEAHVELPVDASDVASADVEAYVAEAAHTLVDTDVAIEDEEGGNGDETSAPQTFVPMADTADATDVEEALDDEMQTIVLNAEREYVPAGAISLGDASPGDHERGEGGGDERAADVTLHVEPGVGDDESPYADAPAPSDATHRPILADAPVSDDALAEAIADARAHLASPVGGIAVVAEPADVAAPNDEESIALSDILALPSPDGANASGDETGASESGAPGESVAATPAAPPAPPHRLQILSARYRLVIKGPDRGKWDVDITHEADAPLDTVERVVRGVAKRAGDDQEPQTFTGDSLRAALAAPVWATTP